MPPFAKCFLASVIWLGIYAPVLAQATPNNRLPQKPQKVTSNNTASNKFEDKPCRMLDNRCLSDQEKQTNINNAPITIVADYAKGQADNRSFYSGDVVIEQGSRKLIADKVTLEQNKSIVTAEGNVRFQDGYFAMQSTDMTRNLETEDSEINNAKYQLLCSSGRGEAKRIFKNGTTFYQLDDGSFTTCPEGDNSWRFSTSKIQKNEGDIFADFYHPRFEVFGAPIFYLPYLRVPVEDGRLTGFLYPTMTVNNANGIELETPFYWNIHPQLDAVLTPKYMTKRGLFFTAEPRYLTHFGQGSMVLEYIGRDRDFNDGDSSWGINWRHQGINNHWRYNIDYSKVSDINYFNRYTDSRIGSREDNTLLQTAEVSYRHNDWDATLNIRDFQPLNLNTSVYRLTPQLALNFYQDQLLPGVDFKLPLQFSQFTTVNDNKPEALRLHAEPTITLPYNSPWFSASAEGKLLYTYYEQTNTQAVKGINGETLDERTSRTIPSARLHAMMTLEREGSLFGSGYRQTLEPQIQYLYIKNQNQSNIYNPVNYANGGFDSARLQTDYYGLFRANQFSGIDYINPANQLTIGAATRFFDDNYKERFNLAFGQIYYFDRPNEIEEGRINFSAWAIESELNLNDRFFVRGSMEYDSNVSELQFGNATLEYRDQKFFAQASYRYVSRNYIASTIGSTNLDLITKDGISQLGFVTGFPLTQNLSLNGQIFYDSTQNMMLENSIGLTYRSDCWLIGIGYNEYLLTRSNINAKPEYDNNVSLSFSLLGLGTNAGFGSNSAKGNTLGYRNPFALKH